MGKLNTSSTSDGQKFEKEEKGDDNMEQKQMEEEQKRKVDEKQTCEMEKEIVSRKARLRTNQSTSRKKSRTRTRKTKQFPIPPSNRRTQQNTSLPSWSKDID